MQFSRSTFASLSLFLFLTTLPTPGAALRILFFLLGTNEHQRMLVEWMAQQFARNNHGVVTVKPILVPEEPRLVRPMLHGVYEKVLKNVLPRELYEPLARIPSDFPWRKGFDAVGHLEPLWAAHNHSCYRMLNSDLLSVLRREQLDVAVVYAGNPCLLGLAHTLGLPIVLIDAEGLGTELLVAADGAWPLPTLTPGALFATFRQRLAHSWAVLTEFLAQTGIFSASFSPRHRALEVPVNAMFRLDNEIRSRFRSRPFPNIDLIRKNAALYLANTDPLLEDAGLSLPSNLIPIGGVHIDAVKPLFSPWNESITRGEQGVILVSLGTQADTRAMPEHMVRAFVGALLKLRRYRVFWRMTPDFELSSNDGAKLNVERVLAEAGATHVNVTTFFPQNELLANARTRLLVTNGGINSVLEAMHWGVPMVGIPLFGRDLCTMEKVERRGLGVALSKQDLGSETTLFSAIRRVLDDSK